VLNLGKWFKKKSGQPSDLKVQPTPVIESSLKKPVPKEVKAAASGLNPKEIQALRQLKFKELAIPYELVLAAEGRGIRGIEPQKITKETKALNEKLALYGFNFKIDYRECFECQVMYLEYENFRQQTKKTKGNMLLEHSLVDIMVLREAERQVRKKYQLTENPATGKAAEKFQAEVKAWFEAAWQKSKKHQLRHQAEQRLKRARDQKNQEPLAETDVKTMIEIIKAERSAIGREV